jgi:hypothetical protein
VEYDGNSPKGKRLQRYGKPMVFRFENDGYTDGGFSTSTPICQRVICIETDYNPSFGVKHGPSNQLFWSVYQLSVAIGISTTKPTIIILVVKQLG